MLTSRQMELNVGVEGKATEQLSCSATTGVGDRVVKDVAGFGRSRCCRCRHGRGERRVDNVSDLFHLRYPQAEGGKGRSAEAYTGGVPRPVGIGWDGVAVGDDSSVKERRFCLATGQTVRGRNVEHDEVIVRATGEQTDASS
jgi:hypothetical protein